MLLLKAPVLVGLLVHSSKLPPGKLADFGEPISIGMVGVENESRV